MKAEKIRFLFCVVTYNSCAIVGPTVASIRRVLGPSDSLVVVDNGSQDGTAAFVREQAPEAEVIEQENRGFGAGNNAAWRAFDSEYFVLVNPDVEIRQFDGEAIERYLREHPEAVALVGDVRYPSGERQYVNKDFPSFAILFARRFAWGPLSRTAAMQMRLRRYELRDADYSRPFRVPCGTGSFQIIRRAAVREPDLFDPRYFMYLEDTDLSRRLWERGETHYLPELVVTHAWHRESHRSWRMTVIHLRSALKYWWKWKSFAPSAKPPR